MADGWPQVSVLLITYKRMDRALLTLEGVRNHLVYPGPLHYHVADDGSGGDHIAQLVAECARDPRAVSVTSTDAARAGVGVSMNLGQHVCWERSDYILWLEDDWQLTAPFNLMPCVAVLRECQDVGMVRLGYMQRGMTGTLEAGGGQLWWRLSWDSSDPYVFTGHAALRHKRFWDFNGDYPAGLTPGDTEGVFSDKVRRRRGPVMLWPGEVCIWGPFGHIGGVSLAGMPVGAAWDGGDTRQTPTAGIGLRPQ